MHRSSRQPREPACDGLADGWARRLANHQPVHAGEVTRGDGPFYCAACHSEVILRKGAERVEHFAHEAEAVYANVGTGEGALHRACKQEMHAALTASHPDGRWEIERTIPALAARGISESRPDLSGRIRGVPVAIEVQGSALDIDAVLRRTRTYAQRGISVLWVVPVPEQLADDAIRPRQHERYFHSMYFGRSYYWWPGMGASVLPVHYASATRPVARSEWFRPGAGRIQVGGYDAPYRAFKVPFCAPRLQIGEDFAPRRRNSFVPGNERKTVPACHLWLDRLAPWW